MKEEAKEEAILFGHTRSLVGILTDPPAPTRGKPLPAIVLLNAGLLHRVGPNRLYVIMARTLAAMGFVVLRFDFSGIGDSEVRTDTLPFGQSVIRETQEAMTWLQTARGSDQFVLMGICAGADAAFRTACDDARVVGAVLINIRGHLHEKSDIPYIALSRSSRASHYWWSAFHSACKMNNWRRALTGNVDYRGILSGMTGIRLSAPKARAKLRRFTERRGRLLHVYSEGDEGLDYLHEMFITKQIHELSTSENLGLEIIPGATHNFTLLWHQECLLRIVHRWVQAMWYPSCRGRGVDEVES